MNGCSFRMVRQLAAVGDVIVYSRLQIDACLGCEVILYAYTCVDRPLPGALTG